MMLAVHTVDDGSYRPEVVLEVVPVVRDVVLDADPVLPVVPVVVPVVEVGVVLVVRVVAC